MEGFNAGAMSGFFQAYVIFSSLVTFVVTLVMYKLFKSGLPYANFVNSAANVRKAVVETVRYIVIPNDKGLKFIDRVIVTPIMRLEVFGLNQGFVKIGEIYHGYFEKVFQHKEHGINVNVNPYLGHVAFVVSAFQTKQFLLHASRAFLSFNLLVFFLLNIVQAPFDYLLNAVFAGDALLVTIPAIVFTAYVSVKMVWAYTRKIVDDVVYIMQNQQDIDPAEFRNFVMDNLAIIGKHGQNIDASLARQAEGYTLATFFNERIESK